MKIDNEDINGRITEIYRRDEFDNELILLVYLYVNTMTTQITVKRKVTNKIMKKRMISHNEFY